MSLIDIGAHGTLPKTEMKEGLSETRETMGMKTHPQCFISKPRRSSRVGMTIGIDLGDIWSHYCTLNEDGEIVDRGRFRTNPSGVD
jgi:hypothetical protein